MYKYKIKGFKLVGSTQPKNIQLILDRPKNLNRSWFVFPLLNGTVEVWVKSGIPDFFLDVQNG